MPGAGGAAPLVVELGAITPAGAAVGGLPVGGEVPVPILATLSATRAGHVGSRGECLSSLEVVEKRSLRSTEPSVAFFRRPQAVQLEVIIPLSSHESAVCSSAQYGHIILSLQWGDVCPALRQFMQQGLLLRPYSVFLLYLP